MPFNHFIKKFQNNGKACFYIKVITGGTRTETAGTMDDGTVKIRVAAVPEKGKANIELIKFLAAAFHVEKTQVKIISGGSSRKKLIEIK